MKLIVEREVSPSRFAEVGRPAGAYRREDGQFVALASTFDRLYWPARAIYKGHWLRHRLSVYSGDLERRVASFDRAGFPINDVAFHPSRPLVAIATGSYDGGFFFEGELVLWNWEEGTHWTVLSDNREAVRCRFSSDSELTVLFRPQHEEELELAAGDPFETFVGAILDDWRSYEELGLSHRQADPRLTPITPASPESLGFDQGELCSEEHEANWNEVMAATSFGERHRVWDIAWAGDDELVAVHDCCQVERWSTDGRQLSQTRGDGRGIQILQRPGGGLLVHVLRSAIVATPPPDRSRLFELRDDELVPYQSFFNAIFASVDGAGRLLCRDTVRLIGKTLRDDHVIEEDGACTLEADLGHYDCFNHYLRIDGANALYFLRGTPPSSHKDKVLCRIESDGTVSELAAWDDRGRHLMNNAAVSVGPDLLVRAYRVYNPSPDHWEAYIEGFVPESGETTWSHRVDALVTTLVSVEDEPLAVYALTDGRVGVLNWKTGEVLFEDVLDIDGLPTVALSMAARGRRLAIGGVAGRIILARLVG
ncbi:MAG: hypothetical protein ACQEVA_01220 [Myxococcota bacterium]